MTKPYRPSNGTEGEIFMEQFCYRCTHDDSENENYCPILTNAFGFGIDEPGYPAEWIVDDDGLSNPRCTKFERRP